MRLRILAVGHRPPAWVSAACEDYLKRLKPVLRTDLVEIPPGTRGREDQGERVLAAIRRDEFVVALDERGKSLRSKELSGWLGTRMNEGIDLVFVIGGADGHADAVRERADLVWSLSPLTFPHALARVVLVEQLYRAVSLLRNHPYHRE